MELSLSRTFAPGSKSSIYMELLFPGAKISRSVVSAYAVGIKW